METNISIPVEAKPEEIKFLHTGHSLVCTVASNGHVLAKKLDRSSRKIDIELEIFAPRSDACLVRIGSELKRLDQIGLGKFTSSQRSRIFNILEQKNVLRYQLGTLIFVGRWE